MLQCWEYEPERRPTFTELYAKTASYVERIAGYLELNFCNPNPLVVTTTNKVTLSVAEPHSGDEERFSSDDSDAFWHTCSLIVVFVLLIVFFIRRHLHAQPVYSIYISHSLPSFNILVKMFLLLCIIIMLLVTLKIKLYIRTSCLNNIFVGGCLPYCTWQLLQPCWLWSHMGTMYMTNPTSCMHC